MSVMKTYRSAIPMRALRPLVPLTVATAAAVGLAVLVAWRMWMPADERLDRAVAAYEEARRAQATQAAARKTVEALAEVRDLLPLRKEFPALVLALSELAHQDRVTLPGMTHAFQTMDDGLALKATMTFQVAGEYVDIRRFIHRLETTGPYLFIESLDVARAGDLHAVRRVVFNIRVVTFLRPDPPEAGNGA